GHSQAILGHAGGLVLLLNGKTLLVVPLALLLSDDVQRAVVPGLRQDRPELSQAREDGVSDLSPGMPGIVVLDIHLGVLVLLGREQVAGLLDVLVFFALGGLQISRVLFASGGFLGQPP